MLLFVLEDHGMISNLYEMTWGRRVEASLSVVPSTSLQRVSP